MIRHEIEPSEIEFYQSKYLSDLGIVKIDQKIFKDNTNPELINALRIIRPDQRLISAKIVTPTLDEFQGRKDQGGWVLGGAESYYQVVRIELETSNGQAESLLVAEKAIHTMGGIQSKVLGETVLMSYMATLNLAPRVFGYANASIYREFLIANNSDQKMSQDEKDLQLSQIINALANVGVRPSRNGIPEVVQHDGRLYLMDGGSGDLDGVHEAINYLVGA